MVWHKISGNLFCLYYYASFALNAFRPLLHNYAENYAGIIGGSLLPVKQHQRSSGARNNTFQVVSLIFLIFNLLVKQLVEIVGDTWPSNFYWMMLKSKDGDTLV